MRLTEVPKVTSPLSDMIGVNLIGDRAAMAKIELERIGIMPAGALGVSFFYHLTAAGSHPAGITFLDRPGAGASSQLRQARGLQIEQDGVIHHLACAHCFSGGLIESYEAGILPGLILVATNPDQIDAVLGGLLLLLQWMRDEGELDWQRIEFPYLLFVANGVYFHRVRYRFVELLERAMMQGQLPDLWPHKMLDLVSHLMRGPTMMLGQRTGHGAATVYHPGSKGLTMISGGDPASRERVRAILAKRNLPVEVDHRPPVSAEIDKALLNLIGNVLGTLFAATPEGRLLPLRVNEIFTEEHQAEILPLGEHLYAIGHAIRAIPGERRFSQDWPSLIARLRGNVHRPSTLQWIAWRLDSGDPLPEMTPTEAALLEPMRYMARDLGLREASAYFTSLAARYRSTLAQLNARRAEVELAR